MLKILLKNCKTNSLSDKSLTKQRIMKWAPGTVCPLCALVARSLQNHIETRPFLEAQCVQRCDKAQLLHKHTHRSIQDTTHDPLAHMPCGPALCLLLHAFKVPRPLALCKAGLGHSELVYPYAFFGVSAHQRTLKGMKILLQKITHLGGRIFFFQSAHLFALRREYRVLVYTRP